ncbi:MAG: acetolactate synthase 3 large subunit [Alphaproteobacteria bacterium]
MANNKKVMTGAEIVLRALVDQGVDTVFGYPGGAVLPIYDQLHEHPKIKHILVRHEQAALHAAEGYARSTGKVGVALVTSGPGATNAVTGLTDALLDSIPIVCLSGQVPTHLIGTDAFQEADTVGITRSCTKANYLVKDKTRLAEIMHEGFYVAQNGRPGPVLIDLPKDIQFSDTEYMSPEKYEHRSYHPQTKGDPVAIKVAAEMLMKAKKPIIYGGGGLINSGTRACELVRELTEVLNTPITLTLMGLGAVDSNHPNFLGMLGMHGTFEANIAMHDCDVMLAVGSRFDDRVTGRLDAFSPNSEKIHIDIDESNINKCVPVDLGIVGDCESVLEDILNVIRAKKFKADEKVLQPWWDAINENRAKDCLSYEQGKDKILPQHAVVKLNELCEKSGRDVRITTEVGQHQMWAAQYMKFKEPNKWMTSGGLGTMGYGFPSAVGVQQANKDALTICIAGDASIQMNIQEMATVTQYKLPVKIFLLNNQWMGMVRQWQELLHEERYSNSYTDSMPDFMKLAEAYNWTGITINTPDELEAGIKKMIDTDGPVFVDCRVANLENCFPMIPSGAAHNEMILAASSDAIGEDGKKMV